MEVIENNKKTIVKKQKYNNFYYYKKDDFIIGDQELIAISERVFDIPFFDFASNIELLSKLKLDIVIYPDRKKSATWMASFFGQLQNLFEKQDACYDKLIKNPTVRILVYSDELKQSISHILE